MTGAGEGQLLDRFLAEGDEEAFEAILRRHGPMVLGVCRRVLADPHDAEDAFQATFLVLVRRAGSIRDRSVLGPWLHGVARRPSPCGPGECQAAAGREQAEGSRWPPVRIPARATGTPPSCGRSSTRRSADSAEKYRSRSSSATWRARRTSRRRSGFAAPSARSRAACRGPARPLRDPPGPARGRPLGGAPGRDARAGAGLGPHGRAPGLDHSRAASRLAAGRAIAAGTVSAAVAALVEQTSRSMSMNIMKFAAAVLTAGLIAAGAGVSAYQAPGRSRPASRSIRGREGRDRKRTRIMEKVQGQPPGPAPGDEKSAAGAESDRPSPRWRRPDTTRPREFRISVSRPYNILHDPVSSPELSIPGHQGAGGPSATWRYERRAGSPPWRTI